MNIQCKKTTYNSEARINEITIAYNQISKVFKNRPSQASVLIQYNENKYITLAIINEINYCLKSNFRDIQEQA